ncbi:MAG TPA: hypothetical protein VGP36_00640 [Mycobacteriales bacterium]|jgi:hypothetical protein|nr:hypothetical protein [Mycobacteriales bacterium]
MVLLPPDGTGRHDPGKEEAARRQRARFARDIGDEEGQAWAHQPKRKRSKLTIGTTIVFLVFIVGGALPLLLHQGDGQLLQANCDTAAVEAGPTRTKLGTDFAWQVAGPRTGPYAVVLDASTVTGPATGPLTIDTGRILAGPIDLPDCRSAQTVTDGPGTAGDHVVTLFRRSGTGWERVAVTSLNVS